MADELILSDTEDDGWADRTATSEPPNIEAELERFRLQWHHEIQQQQRGSTTGGAARSGTDPPMSHESHQDEPSKEEQARFLFLQGVNAERCKRVYDALLYYRRAVRLVPDIESRIGDFKPPRRERLRDKSESSLGMSDVGEEEEADDDLTDLTQHFQRLKVLNSDHSVCQPNVDQRMPHISCLPFEILTYIFKWVVSADLDIYSLEQLSAVCRGFYLCGRDEELWRLICTRTWGLNCGNSLAFGSYRNMYIERPHLRYNGCYIGKTTYYRQGEKGLDNYYSPFQVVDYYRYLRFFPEGKVLMLTTPDDPLTALPKLRSRGSTVQGLLTGFYKLSGDTVNLVLKRKQVADYLPTVYRYKRQRNQPNYNDVEQTFDAEFTVRSVNGRPHWQLAWTHYAIHAVYRSGEETIADFELNGKSYPPLLFSRVRSFIEFSESPLK